MSTEHKDLYDRFFSDLEDAIESGISVGRGYMPDTFSTSDALSAVLGVIKKYSANPHEPIITDDNKEN